MNSPRSLVIAVLAFLLPLTAASSFGNISLASIDYIFAFGDSYTATGFIPAFGLPRLPALGNTTSDGYNWLEYLATNNPTTANSYFDLAVAGATVNNSIVPSGERDLTQQVAVFRQFYSPPTAAVPWKSSNTLFAIWIGINDVGFSYLDGEVLSTIIGSIFVSYNAQIALLYAAGARNFLVLGIPPTSRTPLVQSFGPKVVADFTANVFLFNTALVNYFNAFPAAYPGASFVLFDTGPVFNTILDNPRTYGFEDATTVCTPYTLILDQPNVNLPDCPWPLSEYFWHNTYHPTYPVHSILASVIAATLNSSSKPIPTFAPSITVPATTIRPSSTAIISPTFAMRNISTPSSTPISTSSSLLSLPPFLILLISLFHIL